MSYAVAVLLVVGAAFMLLAAVGVLRLGDVFLRMHAATKAGTMGKVALVTAVALHFGSLSVTARAGVIVMFFFLTAPVASHLIARAAYALGAASSAKMTIDELRVHRQRDDRKNDDPAAGAR